jgi:hypothetical protein
MLKYVCVTIVGVEKHILSLCVALVIQHAMRMRHVILLSVSRPGLLYFYTKRHDFLMCLDLK